LHDCDGALLLDGFTPHETGKAGIARRRHINLQSRHTFGTYLMAHLISKTLFVLGISLAATTLRAAPVSAADANKPAKAKGKNSKSKGKVLTDDEASIHPATPEAEPDIKDNKAMQFNCELGASITIYTNETDSAHLALRWKKRLHRLTRVGTTTGANRFENPNFGLVWIGIPAKGMLLDSRMNHQLANECKSLEQEALVPQPIPAAPIIDVAAPSPAASGAVVGMPPTAPIDVITRPDSAVPAVSGAAVGPTVPGAVLAPPVSGAPVPQATPAAAQATGATAVPAVPVVPIVVEPAMKPLLTTPHSVATPPQTTPAAVAPPTVAPAAATPTPVAPAPAAAPTTTPAPAPVAALSVVAPPAVAAPPVQPAAGPAVTAPSESTMKPLIKAEICDGSGCRSSTNRIGVE
jgi:hypothetical protein